MRIGVIGGGIIGMAVARQLVLARPGAEVVVFEKEAELATHQSGRNSGVLHAGVYYTPGSDKAVFCTRGRRLMVTFCEEQEIPVRTCGKLIVARDASEERGLADLFDRARANQVPDAQLVDRGRMREIEPEIAGVRALHSPATGVVDYAVVTRRLADVATAAGAAVRRGERVDAIQRRGGTISVRTAGGEWSFDAVVVCAGLQSDRVAMAAGFDQDPAIVPFRGGWTRLSDEHAQRVEALVYPVPDPRYPFLGVHLTRTIDDDVLAGPNALLALSREGHGWWDVDRRDVTDMLRWPGFWRLAAAHWQAGVREFVLATSRRLYARQVASYLPGVEAGDLAPAGNGIRAQAVNRAGDMVDDFVLDGEDGLVVVRNAPSPAATSSLAIAEGIVSRLLDEPVSAPEAA